MGDVMNVVRVIMLQAVQVMQVVVNRIGYNVTCLENMSKHTSVHLVERGYCVCDWCGGVAECDYRRVSCTGCLHGGGVCRSEVL